MAQTIEPPPVPASMQFAPKVRMNLPGKFAPRIVAPAMFLALALFCSSPLLAQKGEPELRTVHGSVIDGGENPVASAVVYLVNVKTQAVKTYIADDMGSYRFSGLDPNTDYEVHAEHGDLTSATRTVSSFNSSRDIEVVLKLTHKKKAG